MNDKALKYSYIPWSVAVFLIVFVKDGFTPDNITHIAILVFMFAALAVHNEFKKEGYIKNPKYYFISRCMFFAALVEGSYMITKPVLSSLQITSDMSPIAVMRNYMIDLLFTAPAYFLIFNVLWWLINKYEYSFWEFVVFMALGQALGDGGRTFLFNPGLVLFLPYVMINYHAMNVVPYLRIQNVLPAGRAKNIWRFITPIMLIPGTYFFAGSIIYTVAAMLGLQ